MSDGNECNSKLVKRKRAMHISQGEDDTRYIRKTHKKLKINNIKRVTRKYGRNYLQPQRMVASTGKKRPYWTLDPIGDSTMQQDKGNKRRKLHDKISKSKKYRQKNTITPESPRNRHITNKTGPRGMPIQRGWHSYLRHTYRVSPRVKKRHKLDSTTSSNPKRKRR
jgi:hypothetical protein